MVKPRRAIFFGKLTADVAREGSFNPLVNRSVRLNPIWQTAIGTQSKYVWRAPGTKILEKIRRARKALAREEVIFT
jgi:hypothetical protein